MTRIVVCPDAARLLGKCGPLAALVVLPDDGATCCRVGFDVVALASGESLPPELAHLGLAGDIPLYAAWPVDGAAIEQIVLARDDGTGELTAVFL